MIRKENYKDVLSARDVEEDTVIDKTWFVENEELFLLVERWCWDGFCGSTAVCYTPQLGTDIEKDAVDKICRVLEIDAPKKGKYSFKVKDDYTFFNFNFEAW